LRQWWAQPDHFRWLSGYLGYRNLRGFTRRMMATVVIALGAAPILTMWTPVGPRTAAGWVISVLVAVCCGVMAMMWLIQWPSRRQSVLFILLADACIAASCLVYASPGMTLLGCTTFAALAGYVAPLPRGHPGDRRGDVRFLRRAISGGLGRTRCRG
jgi:hypothetical protein